MEICRVWVVEQELANAIIWNLRACITSNSNNNSSNNSITEVLVACLIILPWVYLQVAANSKLAKLTMWKS